MKMKVAKVIDQARAESEPSVNGVVKPSENGNTRSWIQIVISDSEEYLQSSIDETTETHHMLVHLKGILTTIKHRMNKQNSFHTEKILANLCLICEKQVTLMARLLSLHLDQAREEENRFDKVLEYAELWSKSKRGRATIYEKQKVVSMAAEMETYSENAMIVLRDAEICAAVEELKRLAIESGIVGQTLETS